MCDTNMDSFRTRICLASNSKLLHKTSRQIYVRRNISDPMDERLVEVYSLDVDCY